MFTKLLTDLRFIIGLFFGIVGLILFAATLIFPAESTPLTSIEFDLNLASSIGMLLFSGFMIVSALISNKKN